MAEIGATGCMLDYPIKIAERQAGRLIKLICMKKYCLDGTYEGEYDVGYIYARVEVEIKDGKLVSVRMLEHRNERGKPAESILDDVVKNQSIDVDVVSGATNSSNVINKAIENALNSK